MPDSISKIAADVQVDKGAKNKRSAARPHVLLRAGLQAWVMPQEDPMAQRALD
jgi:hypothetical protein